MISSKEFLDSIGINTSITMISSSYQNYGEMANALSYLGISNIRDTYDNPYAINEFQRMHVDFGAKFDFFIALGNVSPQWQFARIQDHPELVRFVEGYNESDTWWQTYNGATGVAATQALQRDLYNFVKTSPSLANVGVLQATFANQPQSYPLYGDMSMYTDYSSTHSYFGTGNPPGGGVQPLIDQAQVSSSGKPTITTESGYFTMPTSVHGVSEVVQAKYELNLLFDQARAGVKLTYLWELADNYRDNANTNSEDHFGLFNYDWTPKISAVAIHNLKSIMGDVGSITNNTAPQYTIGGLPASAQTMLFQKADGRWMLAVWNDVRLSGPSSQQSVVIASVPITLNLANNQWVTAYDPMVGTSAINPTTNTNSFAFNITDHPILIEIDSSAPVQTASNPLEMPASIITTQSSSVRVNGLALGSNQISQITLSTQNGLLSVTDDFGHQIWQDKKTIVINGTGKQINQYLSNLSYTGSGEMGTDQINITVKNQMGASSIFKIPVSVVSSLNLPNSGGSWLISPEHIQAAQGATNIIAGISLNNAWANGTTGTLDFHASVTVGNLTVAGVTGATIDMKASYSDISAWLKNFQYNQTGLQPAQLNISITDQQGFTSTTTSQINSSIQPVITLSDTANHRFTTARQIAGEQKLTTAQTGLVQMVTQSIGPDGTDTISTPVWNTVQTASIQDNQGGSYATNAFLQTNVSLSGAINGKLILTSAKRGVISLTEGNYNVLVTAHSNGADPVVNGVQQSLNSFVFTLGSGNDTIRVNGDGDQTKVQLTTGSGHAILFGTQGGNQVTFGSGRAEVTGGAGKDDYFYTANSGIDIVQNFDPSRDTLTIAQSLRSGMHIDYLAGSTILEFGSTAHQLVLNAQTSFNPNTIHWV